MDGLIIEFFATNQQVKLERPKLTTAPRG